MFIAIISDVHNNTVNLKKVLDYCEIKSASRRIKKIICCGDLASRETLDFLCDNFSGKIYHTFGNMDFGHFNILAIEHGNKEVIKYRNVEIFKDYGEAEIGGSRISFIHFPREAKELAESGRYDFVFYGHTHKPWTEKIGKCILLNPGNVANDGYPPTFAVWDTDTDNFELIRVNELK